MNRLLLMILMALLLSSGCESVTRDRDAKAIASAVIATETQSVPVPAPAPSPQPGPRKCEDCNGTGRVGDGRVSYPCQKCGGDGVL